MICILAQLQIYIHLLGWESIGCRMILMDICDISVGFCGHVPLASSLSLSLSLPQSFFRLLRSPPLVVPKWKPQNHQIQESFRHFIALKNFVSSKTSPQPTMNHDKLRYSQDSDWQLPEPTFKFRVFLRPETIHKTHQNNPTYKKNKQKHRPQEKN